VLAAVRFLYEHLLLCLKAATLRARMYSNEATGNTYAIIPLFVTCVMPRRICSPLKWTDMQELFGFHALPLFKIFWKGWNSFWTL